MNDKRREQALAVYCKHNTGNANANYYEMRDSAVASMLAFACDQMTEKDAEIARLREDAARLNWLERDESYIDTEGKCHHALFRRNLPITRAAIDAARKEKTRSKFSEFICNAARKDAK